MIKKSIALHNTASNTHSVYSTFDMVYISADGSVSKQPPLTRYSYPIKAAWKRINSITPQAAAAIAVIAILLSRSGIVDFSPLANGAIPAAKKDPSEHWKYMMKDLTFVRTMTEGLKGKTKATTKKGKEILDQIELERIMDGVDFGGPDGHVAEDTGNLYDLEELRVTRCSTTRSAITAYYCGAHVATDSDVAHGYNRKMRNSGTASFRSYLACRHEQGLKDGYHHRSVYRLGIGCKDHLAGYSHAFSIVAQPDGTYFWLQSYIQQYSLSTWMMKVDGTKESGLAGHLTYVELLEKLDRIDRLMNIDSWTWESNNNYLDLFNVDKVIESSKWKPDHRLEMFLWDEACEYPLPDGYQEKDQGGANMTNDKCSGLLGQMSIFSAFGISMDDFEKLLHWQD